MGKNKSTLLVVGGSAGTAVVIVFLALFVMGGGKVPVITQAAVDTTGTISETGTYSPYTISSWHFTIMNELDQDSAFGANDVYGKVFPKGGVDFNTAALDSIVNYAATTGRLTFNGSAVTTSSMGGEDQEYGVLFYQGDGGNNLYSEEVVAGIPSFPDSVSVYTHKTTVFMTKEGTVKESALDNMEGNGSSTVITAWDESSDIVLLNKTTTVVQGTAVWDFSIGNTASGSCLRGAIITLFEDTSDEFTDIEDIKEISLSIKSGSGVVLPDGDLVDEFKAGDSILIASDDDCLGTSDTVTGTLTIVFEDSEADMGTGSLKMCVDDLYEYGDRDLDNDKRASAECVTITIQA